MECIVARTIEREGMPALEEPWMGAVAIKMDEIIHLMPATNGAGKLAGANI